MKVILFSGGVDSTLLAARSDACDLLLSVDYGQPHKVEIGYAARTATALGRRHEVARFPLPIAVDDVIPGRNGVLIAYACAAAQALGAHVVQIGCNYDDREHFPDCRPAFLVPLSAAMGAAYGVRVDAPFIHTRRAKIVEMWRATGLAAWSCYDPQNCQPCGVCRACLSR